MKTIIKKNHSKILYIFFIFLSLNMFFFSTVKCEAKAFDINNIDISRPFEINFNKNEVIDDGFRKAFFELISFILNSTDQKKLKQVKISEIKGMVESFSIKEEKFIDETYFVKFDVAFNRKKVLNYLEKLNIFPSIPLKKKILFIPVLIDGQSKDLLVFTNNKFYNQWNTNIKSFHLIDYILPTEDLEDLNLIKSKYEYIEEYNFKDISNKYNLDDSIIALIFKDENKIRVLSKIIFKDDIILKNQSFSNLNINNESEVEDIIISLKLIYEDYWKNLNQINTSIRLPLNIKLNNNNYSKILEFEKILNETDLIYNFFIFKFDQNFTYYRIIFNGTPSAFLKSMDNNDFNFDTQNKIWVLR